MFRPKTMIKNPLIAAALLVVMATSVVSAGAGDYLSSVLLNGKAVRWHDSTKEIYVRFDDGAGVGGYQPGYDALAKSGFAQWEKALGNRVRFVYTNDLELTDITVHWQSVSSGHAIGTQQVTFHHGGQIFSNADINLALVAPNGRLMTTAEIKATAIHEMGHALGIKGHSPHSGDIMYATANPNDARKTPEQIALSARDISTIQALYAHPAQVTNPPEVHLYGFQQYEYYTRLARNAYNQKDFDRASQYFKQSLAHFKKDDQNHFFYGLSAFNNKDYASAIYALLDHMTYGHTNQSAARLYIAVTLQAAAVDDVNNNRHSRAMHKLKLARRYCYWARNTADQSATDTQEITKLLTLIESQVSVLAQS